MIKKLHVIEGLGFYPNINLALEEYLTNTVEDDTLILYLWQNQQTVVIGRNQNAFTECQVEQLEADGGHLVRRLSGGGAVYHDLGNLNFTFIMASEHFDIARQNQVILNALLDYNLLATQSGRNDLLIDDKKFSGNAYYHHNGRSYHHGTLLVDVEMSKLSHYLRVSEHKLASHSVKSVTSRVVNLNELNPAINIESLKKSLILSASKLLELDPIEKKLTGIELAEVHQLQARYESDEWKYNPKFKATYQNKLKFSWAECEVQLEVINQEISKINFYTDAMMVDFVDELKARLQRTPFTKEVIKPIIASLNIDADKQQDLLTLLFAQEEAHG